MIQFDLATGFELPPFWLNHPQVVISFHDENDLNQTGYLNNPCLVPLKIKLKSEPDKDYWQLPIDPVITISGKNTIVRRQVLKGYGNATKRGSIKEAWSQEDYDVNISGVFISQAGNFPADEITKLRGYCEAREPIQVRSELFVLFNIDYLVIEDFSFPHTKGTENQLFSLKCYSDDKYDLLIKEANR